MIFSRQNLTLNSNFAAHRWRCKHKKYLDTLFLLELRLRKWSKEISIHSLAGAIFTSLFFDLLKQVIALTKPAMEDLKSVVGGRKSLTVSEYSNLWEEYLAPWKVRETGDVRVVSGDRALTNFADKELRLVCS